MDNNKVTVKIYGQEYVIAGDKSREHIIKVANYVDTKMHSIGHAINKASSSSLAALSAVNIADEYFEAIGKIAEVEQLNQQLVKDSEHYVQLWDEAKSKFIQYKQDEQIVTQQKEELMQTIAESDRTILNLKKEAKLAEEERQLASAEAIRELEQKCKEMENNFFDLQMENIQLKSELDRLKKHS